MQPILTDEYTSVPEGAGHWLCARCGKRRSEHLFEHFCYEPSGARVFLRQGYRFVGMMRVKNEARWIARAIESFLPLVEHWWIMDDHSDDDTVDICSRYSEVTVLPSPFRGFDESRDKNWLYDQITTACDPRWIFCIDGDEVLEPGGQQKVLQHIEEAAQPVAPAAVAYALKIEYLWGDEQHVRMDRVYGWFWRPSLFWPFNPGHRFQSTPWGRRRRIELPDGTIKEESGNLHCSSIPQDLIHNHQKLPVRLLHYGYMHREDRVRKLDRYTAQDWNNKAEDSYRHMVQGDDVTLDELPEVQKLLGSGDLSPADVRFMLDVPPDARLAHAGPMQIEPLSTVLARPALIDPAHAA